MKQLIYSILLLFPILTLADTDLGNDIKVKQLEENVYVVTDNAFHASNVLVVKTTDGTVVIVSSPFENLGTQTMVNWIKKSLTPKKIVAINPHFHLDGVGGNEIYKKEGIETWSSDLTKKLRIEENKKDRAGFVANFKEDLKKRLLASNPIPADNTFKIKDGKTFDFSGEKVEVYFPGPSHSPDHAVVYFQKQKLMFGGCMIKPKELGYLGDADVKSWPAAAKNLKKFDVKTVVPGHQPAGGPDLITKTIEVAEKAAANTL